MKSVILLVVFLAGCAAQQQLPELRVVFPDVGQGSSAIILTPDNRTIMFDCGKKIEGIIDDISSFDLKKIDLLVISHPDIDHYGACIDLINKFEVKRIVDNGQDKTTKVHSRYVEARKGVPTYQTVVSDAKDPEFDFVEYLVAYDSWKGFHSGSNENSIVMKIKYGNTVFLLEGDCELKCEKTLRDTSDINADVLQAGHHGSKTSSTDYALEEITPEIAVISVGKNSYGHPDKEAIERIGKYAGRILRTDVNGAIVFKTDGISAYLHSPSVNLVIPQQPASQELP